MRQAIDCCGRHSALIALNGPRTTALSFISPTVIGSDCCGQPGFEIEDLVELRPKPDATTTYQFVTLDWARKWPSKEVWKTRRREALSSSTHSRRRLPSCGRSALLYLYGIDHRATCYEAGPSKEEGMNRQVLICSASGAPSDVLVGRAITMGIDRRHMSGRRHHVNV